ncbi:MerR family transcriptional regulator [Sphingomonas jatrophae]|jgi:Cu(I)-responsive transcriptional regulator|uniref:Cu(I)-responsive transcriptional regulator n=1 Tax=Sphingomonas jatrophae TaxID=1166337 RepID=A0A1I6L6U8_9SPHN|nr:helix-turn-helix domain-containing protein [Sphingomonas jatrophae]SFR99223.1 Cu(I)-responsive transcriptional regulator [Sphingomonas jatrophae]
MVALTIGKLASATGTKVETVRYYERAGLIDPPARTDGNYRAYRPEDLERLRFIRRTRDLGFSLDEVRALLNLAAQRDRDCGTVDELATRHLEEIDRKIADLMALRRELAGVIASCAGGTMADCRILGAFAPSAAS